MLRSRPLLVAARDGPKRSGRSWGSVAGYSVASAAVIVSFPVMLWPVVDGIVLPRVFRWAFEKKKHVQAVPQPGTGRILAHVRSVPGSVIVLTGPQASACAFDLVSRVSNSTDENVSQPTSYVDLSADAELNPYESAALCHLGVMGHFLCVYIKLAIFLSSVISKRHPHVDALLYQHNVNNSCLRALTDMHATRAEKGVGDEQIPVVVVDHLDFALRMSDKSAGHSSETVSLYAGVLEHVRCTARRRAERGLATYVLVVDDLRDPRVKW